MPPESLATAPPARRDAVRLLVGERSTGTVGHHSFRELPGLLRAGDVLVVNTSRTLPAALDAELAGEPVVVHFSTRRDDGRWVVEVRTPDGRGSTVRRAGSPAGAALRLRGGGELLLDRPLVAGADRLWVASPSMADPVPRLHRYGRPIRYGYTERDQPLSAHQTVFARPSPDGRGSAEMPSAARPFTAPLVTELVSRGVQIAPVVLHTGVASAEAHEPPYAEPYAVPAATAWQVNAARAAGGRIVAVGTTAVRALESAADGRGAVRAAAGWTELVVTPERGVRAVDGLLTGLHEPEASHLLMLRAVSGDALLERVYAAALHERYLWHEFGDVNLLLP
ncbi:S-adenosylmethionine:tRNA ribosyltransferase-isomerase [Streptomyces sp. NPDC020983]|uniref:S-adenosylmethionine:tRNA ribosyltransferase-isomerase n=1 Tax=Streptomyces sp. NPDC020983 TaxID=3365106 RepID=UPI0037A7821F